MSRSLLVLLVFALYSCSSDKPQEAAQKGPPRPQAAAVLAENIKHPLAKYIEVAGFRLNEKGGGKLTVRMVVINHSQADINELALEVTTPACTLAVKVGAMGPEESREVSSECVTKMRVYELPDWQFVRPAFKITAPPES